MTEKHHDLVDYLHQISSEIESEYQRIQKRATEDPGTAGDQGEENWATILRGWLPPTYRVVTKGRLIDQSGRTSPQVDVIVLKPSYPTKLVDKKLYLVAGVAAVFECKTTLKSSHIIEAVKTCAVVKDFVPARVGTQHREVYTPLIFGLLAHSHSWKGVNSDPAENINNTLLQADLDLCHHPRFQLDCVCVADLMAWTQVYSPFVGPGTWGVGYEQLASSYGPNGASTTGFCRHHRPEDHTADAYSPIGIFIMDLFTRLSWDDPSCRALARYYSTVIRMPGSWRMRPWPSTIFSPGIKGKVETGQLLLSPQFWDDYEAGIIG